VRQHCLRTGGRGILEESFWLWFGYSIGNEEPEEVEKAWRKLRSNEKAHWLLKYLLERRVLTTFFVVDTDISDYFVAFGYNNRVLYLEEWGKNFLGLLYGSLLSEGVRRELMQRLRELSVPIELKRLNPPDKLRLQDAVLDLETGELLPLEEVDDYWFTYTAPLYTERPLSVGGPSLRSIIRSIDRGEYNIENNKVYRLFRERFPGSNWEYLTDALGAVLAPEPLKLILLIVGGTDAGKSTFLRVLFGPLAPVVTYMRLEDILEYRFGRSELIGKFVLVNYESVETAVRKLEMLNTLFGASDMMDVPVKFKKAARISSLKLGVVACNEPPIVKEYKVQTLKAFLNRLSLVQMVLPEGAVNIPHVERQVEPEEAFAFLWWCRRKLEQKGWKPERMEEEKMLALLREQTNPVLRFLAEGTMVVQDPEGRIKGTELYELYLRWCENKGISPVDRNTFYTWVSTRFEDFVREGVKWFRGLRAASERKERELDTYELTRFEV